MCEEKIYEVGNYASYFKSCVFSITLSTLVPPLRLLFLPLVLLMLLLPSQTPTVLLLLIVNDFENGA